MLKHRTCGTGNFQKIIGLASMILVLASGVPSITAEAQAAGRTCAVGGCSISTSAGNAYCHVHGCSREGCQNKRLTGSSFCTSHTCSNSGCLREASEENGKCLQHMNMYSRAPVRGSSGRSSTYGRSTKPSSTPSVPDITSYFALCDHPGCPNVRAAGRKYCTTHAWQEKSSRNKTWGSSSSQSGSGTAGSPSGSSKYKSVEDVDFDMFYEDYRDEFESEDDAWDYLEDEPGEWDDY